jgi:hypothetical protein
LQQGAEFVLTRKPASLPCFLARFFVSALRIARKKKKKQSWTVTAAAGTLSTDSPFMHLKFTTLLEFKPNQNVYFKF